MTCSRKFFIFAAACSFISAATTLILIFGPRFYPAPQSFVDSLPLLHNPAYQLRMWVAYVHPFLSFASALGMYVIARRFDGGFALIGIVFFGVWAFAEALQQSLTIVAMNWTWRGTYAAADEATRSLYRSHADMYGALWDSLYFLVLTAFLLANVCFGAMLAGRSGFDRLMGILLLAAGGLSGLYFFAAFGGPRWTGSVANLIYPVLQPASRVLLGVWILIRGTPSTLSAVGRGTAGSTNS